MRRFSFLFSCLIILLTIPAAAKPVEVLLFTAPWCPHCQLLHKDGFVDTLRQKYGAKLHITDYNITEGTNNVLFQQKLKNFPNANAGIPALFVGDQLFQGYPSHIATQAETAIIQAIKAQEAAEKTAKATQKHTPQTTPATVPDTLPQPGNTLSARTEHEIHENFFNQLTLWTIIGAGLVDGINPCAFAVIVFFVSFLAAYKYNKKEIIVVGSAYCSAVFLAYVLMGLGAFHFLYALKGFHYVTLAVQWGTLILCGIFFLLCVYDFIIYQRTKKSEKMLLQLSKNQKTYIHKVMRFFLKDKHSSWVRLLAAAFVVGFVVSGVEAVCTGQVYLPTIVIILKEADRYFLKAAVYLLTYNLMFILPLVLVFVLTLCGKESATFNNWLKKHLGLSKFLLCCVFLGLFLLLYYTMH